MTSTPQHIGRRTALAGGLALAATSRARAQRDTAVRIGVLTDQNGPYADASGSGAVLAAQMAAKDFGPTVLGLPIEIVPGDTQNKPDIAGAVARKMFDSQGVDMITDLPVTPVAAAVQQVAREKQRSVITTAAAAAEFTSKGCAPTLTHWADDTHALAAGVAAPIVAAGGKTWFFITVDFAFGLALERESDAIIGAGGGRVLGAARYPLGTTDFSSLILQAQASGAEIVGLASVGGDLVNLIKQAGEFGLGQDGKQRLAGFLIYITDIHALGQKTAAGFTFPSGFYWDQNDTARAWSQRFFAEHKAMPTRAQAGTYAATTHFLRAMAQAGTRDAIAVNKAMRALPADYLGKPASIRADGRALYDISLYRVKPASESKAPWDYYTQVGTLPAERAFLPIVDACK